MDKETAALYGKLENKLFITRDARFEAERRIRRRRLSSNVSLAVLSMSVIVFNVLQLFPAYKNLNDKITIVTIIFSVLILGITLLISGQNYAEREEKYHNCALRLSEFIDQLRCRKDKITKDNIWNEYRAYHSILKECPYNHIKIDYDRAVFISDANTKKGLSHDQRRSRQAANQHQEANPQAEGAQPQAAGQQGEQNGSQPQAGGEKNNKWDWDKIWEHISIYICRKCNQLCIWVRWNILDLSMLNWLLALVLPAVAAWLIFFADWTLPECKDYPPKPKSESVTQALHTQSNISPGKQFPNHFVRNSSPF